MVRFSYDIQKCIGKLEYGTNWYFKRIHRKHLRIICESGKNKGNSWQFLTIRRIFSLKLGINVIYPCSGITSKINVHRCTAVVLTLHLECQYQLLIIRRRLLRKKNKER